MKRWGKSPTGAKAKPAPETVPDEVEIDPALDNRSLVLALKDLTDRGEVEAPIDPGPRETTDLSQAMGGQAPELSYAQGRQEVVCGRCFTQALPRRRLAGARILALLVAGGGPILVGVVLVLLSNPTDEWDQATQTIMTVNQLVVPWWVWAICLPLGLIPAVAYHFWRVARGRWVCLSCGDTNIWEAHSSVARALVARHTSKSPAYPFE